MDHAHENLAIILERAPERFNELLDRSAATIGSDIVNYVPGHGSEPSTRIIALLRLAQQQNKLPDLVTYLDRIVRQLPRTRH